MSQPRRHIANLRNARRVVKTLCGLDLVLRVDGDRLASPTFPATCRSCLRIAEEDLGIGPPRRIRRPRLRLVRGEA